MFEDHGAFVQAASRAAVLEEGHPCDAGCPFSEMSKKRKKSSETLRQGKPFLLHLQSLHTSTNWPLPG